MAEEYDLLEHEDEEETSEDNEIIPADDYTPDSMEDIADQLKQHIVALGKSTEHVAFVMGVNVNDGRATIVPLPLIDNVVRLKQHLNRFPEAIRDAIKNSMNQDDLEALEYIWAFLDEDRILLDHDG